MSVYLRALGELIKKQATKSTKSTKSTKPTTDKDTSQKEQTAIGRGSIDAGVQEGTDDSVTFNISIAVEQDAGDVTYDYTD